MAKTVTIKFAGSIIEAKLLTTGEMEITIKLPSGGVITFVDVDGSIPEDVIAAILADYPEDSDFILSLVAEWANLSQYLLKQLYVDNAVTDSITPVTDSGIGPAVESPTNTTDYNSQSNAQTTNTVVPTTQQNVNPSSDPSIKPVAYTNPTDPAAPRSPNPPITSVSKNQLSVTPAPSASARGLQGAIQAARAYATAQDQDVSNTTADWRVKLTLGTGADYLYKAASPGILAPLKATDGVIFPYTPQISVSYASNYDDSNIVHSNYKIFQYRNSSVDNISVTCDFTAQDTYEANYLLAVIHFLRSLTKMFYGQDQSPKNGTPPPLCFLTGLGQYQFNGHPLIISNFTYNLPTDVDYIRANVNVNTAPDTITEYSPENITRLTGGLQPGGVAQPPRWSSPQNNMVAPTYVPTRMQISFQAHPIVTRNVISNYFSVKQYATGNLLSGGIW